MEEIRTSDLVGKNSLFWSPDYLEVSAWLEHIPFAFWIVEVLKPKIIVELGVHNGASYFAFCQAVKALNFDSACYGIDTWKGDEHSGFYEDEVYGKVSGYNGAQYSRFSTLIRSSFDEAKDYFVDQSIELLHIDGLHTYEAVKHDFETWLPKLTPDAFIIFHDINVRERQFGVFGLWEELKVRYEYLQFDFGHGLGIIALGKIHAGELKGLFSNNKTDAYYLFLRNLFAERGVAFKLKLEHSLSLQKEINNKNELRTANAQLTENYKTLEIHYFQLIEERKAYEAKIEALNQTTQSHELNHNVLNEKFKTVTAAHDQLLERRDYLQNQLGQITELYNSLLTNNEQSQKTLRELEIKNQQLVEKNKVIEQQYHQLNEQCQKTQLNNDLLTKKQLEDSAELSTVIDKLNSSLGIQTNANKELETVVEDQKQTIQWYKNTYENRSILGIFKENLKKLFKKESKR